MPQNVDGVYDYTKPWRTGVPLRNSEHVIGMIGVWLVRIRRQFAAAVDAHAGSLREDC